MPAAPKRPCRTPRCPHALPCPDHPAVLYRQTNTADERRFYASHRWTLTSRRHREREPFCRACLTAGRYTLGVVADHIVPLRQGGPRWDESNLQTLCRACDQRKRQGERYSAPYSAEVEQQRFPKDLPRAGGQLTMVCGPPGAGKSTYVREHAGPDDVVIELDQIMQTFTGLPEHQTSVTHLPAALAKRNDVLRSLESSTGHAWFVISLPVPRERNHWAAMLGAEVVVLTTPLDECIRRIHADPARAGHTARMVHAATQWWALNGFSPA